MNRDVLRAITTDIELGKAFASAGNHISDFKGEYSFYHLDRNNPEKDVMVSSLVIGEDGNDPFSCSLTRKYIDIEGFAPINQKAKGKFFPTESNRGFALLMCARFPMTLHVDLAQTLEVEEGVRNMVGSIMTTEQPDVRSFSPISTASPFYAVRTDLPVYPLVMPANDIRLETAREALFGRPKLQL